MSRVGRTRSKDKHLPPRVYLKHGAYYFVPRPAERERYGGTWIKLGTIESEAIAKFYELTNPPQDSLEAIWQWYERRWLPANSERTQTDKRGYWEVLKPVFGNCHPDTVEPGDIYDYLEERHEMGAPIQGKKEIALLSHMYTKAVAKRKARFNPCLRVERPKSKPRDLDVTADMMKDWITFAPKKLGLAAELMYMTGLRSPDILKIRLPDITEDRLQFQAGKTGKKGWFPMTPELKAVIKEIRALAVKREKGKKIPLLTQYLFCTRQGIRMTKSGFDSMWQRHMREFATKGFTRFAPNDCRAGHATELDEQGGNATRNLQHSTSRVTDAHYLRRGKKLETLRRVK
jgi:integrase